MTITKSCWSQRTGSSAAVTFYYKRTTTQKPYLQMRNKRVRLIDLFNARICDDPPGKSFAGNNTSTYVLPEPAKSKPGSLALPISAGQLELRGPGEELAPFTLAEAGQFYDRFVVGWERFFRSDLLPLTLRIRLFRKDFQFQCLDLGGDTYDL